MFGDGKLVLREHESIDLLVIFLYVKILNVIIEREYKREWPRDLRSSP